MWDNALIDKSGLLIRPLLMLWRQSVELALKAAIMEIVGETGQNPGHDLSKLFVQLLKARADTGYCDDDEYTRDVQDMIAHVQSFDPFADRFRYPTSKRGEPFDGVDIDFDELFQAHWRIVTWCESAAIEVVESRGPAS
jgi:HEPN domain-containing protein